MEIVHAQWSAWLKVPIGGTCVALFDRTKYKTQSEKDNGYVRLSRTGSEVYNVVPFCMHIPWMNVIYNGYL